MAEKKKTKLDTFLEEWRKDHKGNRKSKKSYSHKPHLGSLPYDLNTNDPKKLKERLKENNKRLREARRNYIDAVENNDMMENNIKEIEENEKIFKEEIQKMEEENARISETREKIHDHFEDVTMMTEEDGWEIKKTYDELKKYSLSSEITDEMDEVMNEFIDEVSLLGYIPDTYPKDDSISAKTYIDSKFNPLIEKFLTIAGEHSSLDDPAKDSNEFVATCDRIVDQMEKYRDNYSIDKDTPLTKELKKIEDDGKLPDTWYMTEQKNNKKIKEINETIDKENERKEGIKERQKENRREMGKLATRVNDHEDQELKILAKLEKVDKND